MLKLDTLAKRLLVPSLSLMAVGTCILGIFLVNMFMGTMEKSVSDGGRQTADFTAQMAGPYITNYDLTALGAFVKGLTKDSEMVYAEFFDGEGKSLTSDLMTRPANADQLLIFESPIKDGAGKQIGKFVLGHTVDALRSTERRAMTSVAVGVVVLLAVLALGLVWAVRKALEQIGGEPSVAIAAADAIKDGNLSTQMNLRPGDTHSLMHSLREMQTSLAAVVTQVRTGAESVATASAEIASGNSDLSSRTENQASALEETASSMEQLGTTVRRNAESAAQANQLAQSASDVARRGGEVVGQVVETMRGISDASRRIADIISVIDGIAFQTNILALNAAVEAARAGEQGRGFAVVATEVRSLAGRSADAAKEIKSLISASVERVEQGTVQVDQAGNTMQEVVDAIRRVTDIVGEITSASQEQSSGVAHVGEAVTSLDHSTQQNAAMVEEIAAAADSLRNQANDLVQAVSVFRL